MGHDVRLMQPQFVKPYVKSQKNDAADAEAICEAVQRPTMRFVPIKSAEQQAVLLLHRTRDLLVRQRSSLISAIRAHFAEFGIVVGHGIRNVERLLGLLQSAGDQRLPALAAEMLGVLAGQLRDVAVRVRNVEMRLVAWHRSDAVSRRLESVPGIGPITASAMVATVGDPRQFRSGRRRSNDRVVAESGSAASRSTATAISARARPRRPRDRGLAPALGGAPNALDRAPAGAPADERRSRCLRQQARSHRLGDYDARKPI